MSIEIEQGFTIESPIDVVWSFLTDPRRVAMCLPGAAITEQLDERTYAGTMTVKVGPVMSSYRGKMEFVRLDEDAWIAEISASAQDIRGKGGAEMRMTSQLRQVGEKQTEVTVKSDVSVIGLLAQLGRGMIEDVSDQLFKQFSSAMPYARAWISQVAPAGSERTSTIESVFPSTTTRPEVVGSTARVSARITTLVSEVSTVEFATVIRSKRSA